LEWTAAKLDLIAAWAATPARTVRVAVIDSGADTFRPDLSSTVVRVHDATLHGSDPRTDSEGHGTHVASLACAGVGDGAGIAGAGGRACRLIIEKSDLTDVSIAAAIVDAVDRRHRGARAGSEPGAQGAPRHPHRRAQHGQGAIVRPGLGHPGRGGRGAPCEGGGMKGRADSQLLLANILRGRKTLPA